MQRDIYLDNSATTPVSTEVSKAMEPYWAVQYGNPSSPHLRGVAAEKTLNHCRRVLAELLHSAPHELFFTGSGTEANNIAIQGIAVAPHLIQKPGHIITTSVEHPSVLNVVKHLEALGWEATYLGVNKHGRIDPAEVGAALRPETRLVSVMMVNNELGTVMPIAEVGELLQAENRNRTIPIVFHVDAIQALGKVSFDLHKVNVDMFSFSGHKLFGPKGIGLLYVRQGTPLRPIMFGGNQERGIRPGTENIPAIAGLTKAVELAIENFDSNTKLMGELRTQLINGITGIPDSFINSPFEGAPHILNVRFTGIRSEVLVHFLEQKRIFVSMGAACSSRRRGASHVLEAIGLSPEEVLGSIRVSLAPTLTPDDISYVTTALAETVKEIRKIYM